VVVEALAKLEILRYPVLAVLAVMGLLTQSPEHPLPEPVAVVGVLASLVALVVPVGEARVGLARLVLAFLEQLTPEVGVVELILVLIVALVVPVLLS